MFFEDRFYVVVDADNDLQVLFFSKSKKKSNCFVSDFSDRSNNLIVQRMPGSAIIASIKYFERRKWKKYYTENLE